MEPNPITALDAGNALSAYSRQWPSASEFYRYASHIGMPLKY